MTPERREQCRAARARYYAKHKERINAKRARPRPPAMTAEERRERRRKPDGYIARARAREAQLALEVTCSHF